MIQTKYEQQNLLESSLSIIDTLVSQAAKTEIGSIAAAYLIQANQEINLLELQYSGESTIQQQLYRVKIAFIKIANCNSKLASADKAHRRKGSWEFQVNQD
ncbi:hypothetical protein M3M33_07750 [Loigolactobacillus coryniformis]|uniref:hypothetical protein n=2 Tax=Loigolactobacillus coryniformis TaxID=1610 RepID=UPI00201A5601|nr:hypothetical protein [Loigolactobacillus coryniformis]MCL5458546.1 hypothetical protein [Loigolactobacillus coryniformis]